MKLKVVVLSILLTACGGAQERTVAQGIEPTPSTPVSSEVDASSYEAQLASADASDGTVDHVVTNCAGCGLGMSGDSSHSTQIGEYELHLCSGSCLDSFVSDPVAVLERLPTD